MFIKIFEKETKEIGNGMYEVTLRQVCQQSNLTEEEYEELDDYFIDNTPSDKTITHGSTRTFELVNHWEYLENSPLPDGAVINADSFKEIPYIVVIGKKLSPFNTTEAGLYL